MPAELLSKIRSPLDIQDLTVEELKQLAEEIRETLCHLVSDRTAHFASNLGVVELCLALHQVFDFSQDRLIWDTGHQIYPHKLITGRYENFASIRERGGLMGYPNPNESPYDLFMTGHAGASVSTVLGLKTGDDLLHTSGRKAVAVLGDGALPSGMVFEAFNNAVGLKKNLLVILNDNKMGICPRVGGLAHYLDKARTAPLYSGIKRDVSWLLNKVPLVGQSMEHALGQMKEAIKTLFQGGMLFEELGFRYVGPIDGHDLVSLSEYLQMVKDLEGPVLLHVFTEKGHGVKPACEDPVKFHTPPPFSITEHDEVVTNPQNSSRAYTNVVSQGIYDSMQRDEQVVVVTAAMCAGNKLDPIRKDFPERFFDTGICESHAVAFAAGMAKSGLKPIVDIYSTFLQRSFDQIFQEVALQDLPVTFCLDRSGLCGPDGPTHHGAYDVSYMRVFPNMIVMAPGDELDVTEMLNFAIACEHPCSLRYPKAAVESVKREPQPVELGRAETISEGTDGTLLVLGTLLHNALAASERLKSQGLDVGVVNMRFAKPIDLSAVRRAITNTEFVITVEENALAGGFGSAVLEAANADGLPTDRIRCLGIPDRFIEHGDRAELLQSLDLDVDGICRVSEMLAGHRSLVQD